MTNKLSIATVLGLAALTASACTSTSYTIRPEALTLGAGDAQAANTVMQMVDPWPVGVNDTDLNVPADLRQHKPERGNDVNGVSTSDLTN